MGRVFRKPVNRRSRLRLESLEKRCLLTAQVEGLVWHDLDRDGLWSGSDYEYPLAGITVNLLDESLAVFASAETDDDGQFRFVELSAGNYTVEFELPDGAEFTRQSPTVNQYTSTVDPVTGRTAPFSLQEFEFSHTNYAGMFAPAGAASVSGRVWLDQDGDGVQDQGEPGIANAEVQLENSLLDKLLETYTDNQGNYRFDGQSLFPGDYVIDFVKPHREPDAPKWQISPLTTGDDVDLSLNSDASSENGKTAPFTLLPGEIGGADVVLDAGFFRSARIEGMVWHDVDRDGIRDDNDEEHGVTGIAVNLLDADLMPLQTTVSDVEGRFEFRGLSAGDFIAEFAAPDGTALALQDQGTEPFDSDVDPATGRTAAFTLAGSEHNSELAAGLYAPFGTASLVGRVWHDIDGDGLQDPSEPGLAGSEVQLENTFFGKVLEVDTDQDGNYRFDGRDLLPGRYLIDFKRPPKRGVDARWQISPRNVDNDAASTVDSDAQPTNGKTPPFHLPPATADATPSDMSRDAGFFRFAQVEGVVWDDTNRDGIRDPLEPSAQGVHVGLLDADLELVESVRTAADGSFVFEELYSGNYTLQFAAPFGTWFSPAGLGTFNRQGSSADPVDGITAPFPASSGETIVRNAGIHGLTRATSVSGVAWDDVDGDGRRGATEPGIEGVRVGLFDSRSRKVGETLTQAGGSYRFIGLGSDTYSLRFDVPEESTLSPMNQGDDDLADSDVNRWTGQTSAFTLLTGQHDSTQDVGFYRGPLSTDVVGSLRVTEVGFIGHGNAEFTEVKNIGMQPIDLRGVRFTKGIKFDFSTSGTTSLFPGEHAVVVGATNTLSKRFDLNLLNVAGEYRGDLDRDEKLTLVDASDNIVNSFRYDDDWFVIMDNEYLPWTLTVIDEHAETSAWERRSNWRPSSILAGSPGSNDPRTMPDPGAIVISEVMTKSSDGFNDLIEIQNNTDTDIDVGNWYLGDSDQEVEPLIYLTRYRIAPGTVLPARGYLTFSREEHFANPLDPGLNYPFGLSSFGEAVHLIAADEYGNMMGYSDSASFDGSEIDVSFGRYVTSTGDAFYTPTVQKSFGAANSEPRIAPVVINEIMYHPGDDGDEYIQLFNSSDSQVDLSAGTRPWKISSAIDFDFPMGANIPAGGYALIVPIAPAEFRAKYSISGNVPIYGPFKESLNNGGEEITLFRYTDEGRKILVDRVNYNDVSPWPAEADLGSISLIRISPADFGDDPANWTHSAAAYAPRDVIWDGNARVGQVGDGVSWDDPSNWTVDGVHDVSPTIVESGGVTPASRSLGDRLTFRIGSTVDSIDTGSDRFVNSLSFHDDFTLRSAAELTVSSGVVTVDAGVTATINVDLVSSRGIVKKGAGTLVIGGVAGNMVIESGTVNVLGQAGSIDLESGTLNVAGTVENVRVVDGAVTVNGEAGNIDMDTGSLTIDGNVGDVIARDAVVEINGNAGVTRVHSGTLVVNGSAGLVEIVEATLAGSASVNGLNVARGGTIELGSASGVLTVDGQANIEGTLVVDLDRDSVSMDVSRQLALSPGSALQLQAVEKLGVPGELYWKVASGLRLKGAFSHEPAINSHIGHGVFVGEVYQAESAVVYVENSVWAVLRQASPGDANGDGRFDQVDVVFALQGAKYQTGHPADWTQGDWNDDGRFDRHDVVTALQSGKYLA